MTLLKATPSAPASIVEKREKSVDNSLGRKSISNDQKEALSLHWP